MKQALSLIALIAAAPTFADGARQLDAHEHGVGVLNIAIDGTAVAMEFHAPGADIVGFEYAAKSDADHAAIETAVATLEAPLNLFVLPDAAACTVTSAKAELESAEHDDEHEHDEHEHDDHDHDHNEEHHDKHSEEDHDAHDKDEHDHGDEASHTEFHAKYMLGCDNPDALNQISFAYFDTFPNAKEVEVQLITAAGAQAYEVERDAPVLKLER